MSVKYPFLDLLEKKLDSAQSTALETVENAVIAAGAGSGKTQVLATRFAWLVITGQAKADEILTLTFTNKAAAEMYKRIYDTLNFFANAEVSKSLTANQKQLAQNALSDFANAHIQTLDSYCANIVRQCANRYGIRPDFATGSSDGERDIKNRALKYTLNNATRPGIQAFAEAGKLQDFANKKLTYAITKCTDITTPNGFFLSKLPIQLEIACNSLSFYLSDKEQENQKLPGTLNILKILNQIENDFKSDLEPKKHLEYKTTVQNALASAKTDLCGIKFNAEDIAENSKKIDSLRITVKEFADLIGPLVALRKGKIATVSSSLKLLRDTVLPAINSILAFAGQYQQLKDLYSAFDDFLEEINSAKRLSGNLSFSDISALALLILSENPDIRQQEINNYKKIMIDEFQDNNGKNRDLLYLLSLKSGTPVDPNKDIYSQIIVKDSDGNIIEDKRSPEKLFFVGDEKQSIYKFRGADVSVFNELTSHNENKLIPMTYNYRSEKETVKAFNVLFANGYGIFDEKVNSKDYEAYYNQDALKNGIELPDLTSENVPFHMRFVNTNKLSKENETIKNPIEKYIPAEDQIGYFIAKQIYELAKDNKKWDSFAILDKSRTHRSSITKYLSLYNIPYEMDQVSNIFDEGIINDFYNFLRICVYPSDVNAYAAYLCSPLSGLTQSSVEIILSHLTDISDRNFVFNPFADCDEKIKADLCEEQFKKYVNARTFYQDNKKIVLQQKLTTTLNLLWNETGYKYESMLNSQVQLCAEHFDLMFELARTCEESDKSISWFIDELEALKSKWSSDDSDLDAGNVTYPLERSAAVQIMTVHKSKGLQFDYVFLCGCTGVEAKAEKGEIFFEEETGASIKPEKGSSNFLCLLQKEMATKKELAEFRRLIYVGITRAIKDVYIMGSWNPESDKSEAEKSDFHLFERLAENSCENKNSDVLQYRQGDAFDFLNIPLVTYEQSRANNNKTENPDFARKNRINDLRSVYENASEIVYETNPVARNCPSALEKDKTFLSEDSLKDDLRQENKEESQLRTAEFTAADFGTLVHAYLEAQANGIAPENFQPPVKLFKNLEQEGKLSVSSEKEKCINFAHVFASTTAGLELEKCKTASRFYRAEWEFKMYWEKTIWTGSIDLIYEKEDGTYQIIDYKSDEKVNPSKYEGQQKCYRIAAAKMLGIPVNKIECALWFMKSNELISLELDDHQ